MRREQPELFERAADLERTLQDRRKALNKDMVYISSIGGRKERSLRDGYQSSWAYSTGNQRKVVSLDIA